jgi:hypothetical protein
MESVLMDQVKLPLKMVINIKVNFIMDYCTVKASLSGVMEFNIKGNSLIIELQVMVFIDGLTAVYIKAKSKMV